MKQFVRDYSIKERKLLLNNLKTVKSLRKEQIKTLDDLIVKLKVDVKRIEMVRDNKLPIKAILRAD